MGHHYEDDFISENKSILDIWKDSMDAHKVRNENNSMTLLDKEVVIRDLKHRMGYKEESERICSYCKNNEEQGEELQCVFNPTYKFRVSPLGSCTNFGHTDLHMDLHKL